MGVFDTALAATSLTLLAPLLLAAMGELISELAGVINIGLEGYMAVGAFFGFWAAYQSSNLVVGVAIGALAGAILASLMALLAVVTRANQIVVGVGLNLVGVGAATLGFRQVFGSNPGATVPRSRPLAIPGLSRIPGVGPTLFATTPVVYLTLLFVPALWLLLYRTSWGLQVRSCGDHPSAADTSGIDVTRVRVVAVVGAGLLAGVGGAALSTLQLGLYEEGLVSGRGFLALAAVIFGRWRPVGVLVACTVFAAAEALQLRFQAEGALPGEVWILFAAILALRALWLLRRHVLDPSHRSAIGAALAAGGLALALWLATARPAVALPYQLWRCLPYVLTLAALAGATGQGPAPEALTLPYVREDDR